MRRDRVFSSLCGAVVVLLLWSFGGCGPKESAAPAASAVPLKDQMRQPWSPDRSKFVQEFLVCGPFAEPIPHSAPSTSAPSAGPVVIRPAAFLDYLASEGGEAKVRPQKGQTATTRDGLRLTWSTYKSKASLVNLREAFPSAKEKSCVAYAYATVHRDRPGKAMMAVWGRAFLTVYLNGKRVVDPNDRDAVVGGAYLPISLEAGDNALLVRVAGASDRWPFSLRVMNETDVPMDDEGLLCALIVSKRDSTELSVKVGNDNCLAPPTVTVEVLGPAGKLAAQADVPLGKTHAFDTADWADGPYEVRALSHAPDGKPMARDLMWYKGDWRPEVAAVMEQTEKLPKDSSDPSVLKKHLVRDILFARLKGDIRDTKILNQTTQPSETPELNRIISALLEYREVQFQEKTSEVTGSFYRLAWRDEVDDSPQFARVFLPLNYDPNRKYPLIVSLHGYNARNPTYAANDPASRHYNMSEEFDVIFMMPHGRGNASYQGIGEADVMRAVAEARKTLSIDPDRIYLTGQSMGGGGAWYIGTRHTDVFAAIAPVYGGWDYHAVTKEKEFASWPPQRVMLEDFYSSFAQAEALLDTPVFVFHGDSDTLVNPANSHYVVRMLQRWDYDVRYFEVPGKGHATLGVDDEIVQWFLQHKLQRVPRHVRLRTAFLHGADAHWLHAEQQEDPFAFMLVDAQIGQDNLIRLASQNVLQIRLNPPRELLDPNRPVKVVWNDAVAYDGALPPQGEMTVRADGYIPGPRFKKPSGPTPFAIVVGTTSKDERMKRFCQVLADRACGYWKTWQHVDPRVFKDTEITDEQIRSYSLTLYGGPEDNAVTARLIKDIPLELADDKIVIDGKTFAVRDAAVRMVYAHPLNADRNVTIFAANSPDAMFWVDRLSDDVDVVIDDGRLGGENDYFANIVAWGSFDCHWRLNEKYLTVGDPHRRAAAPVRKVPRHLTTAVAARRLMLSDVLETAASGSFTRMTRDRAQQGKPLKLAGKTYASGIAVESWHEPCWVQYDLSGGWKRLKATIGIEIDKPPQEITPLNREGTRVVFIVRGDGKELFTSGEFGVDSKPVSIDVDVTGIKSLELEVTNKARWHNAASSVDWADIRLEK